MFLGVDGGGTTTEICLLDRHGGLAGQVSAPGCRHLGDRDAATAVAALLGAAVQAVCTQAGADRREVAHAFLGLPGHGEGAEEFRWLRPTLRAVLGHSRYTVGNDMVCGWAGSLGAVDGINVISGTGSMAYGEFEGRRARVGGWGELFGDEGSGYWIATEGLRAFSWMSDGRLPPGPLLRAMREHLALARDLDLIDVALHRWEARRRDVASLAPVVVRAAREGDGAAADILDRAARELAALVHAASTMLGCPAEHTVTVSWSGGVFAAPEVREAFGRRLRGLPGHYDLREPLHPPAVGAALYAARLAGASLDRTLTNEWTGPV